MKSPKENIPMEKESYSIDDILSEVKKRRDNDSSDSTENDVTETEEKANSEKDSQPTAEDTPEEAAIEGDLEEAVESSDSEEIQPEQTEEDSFEPEIVEKEPENNTKDAEAEKTDGMVDLFALGNDDSILGEEKAEDTEPEKQKFFATKKGKILKAVIICLVILILGAGIFLGVKLYKQIDNMTDKNSDSSVQQEEWKGMGELEEEYPEIIETDATQLSSLQDMIKTWYYNGEPCHSTHVLNVLLLGEDTRGNEILEEGTRADSSIIVSINTDTGKITLTSVLRDAYAYWEAKPGDESTGIFGKINGSMNLEGGNVNTYINAIERLYKVNIDNYVIVNFDSFKKIIDAMGGVTLELTSAEIREINTHPKRYGDVYIEQTFDGNKGEMLLNGKQALAYCRIRKLDSDNMRADRQKTTLMAIFQQAKGESKATLAKIANALMPYVKTGFSAKNIISIVTYAFTEGWLGYDTQMISVPNARINEIGGMSYGAWCWRPDFPQDAHYLQTLLYGKTGIKLAQTRVDVAKCEDYGFFSEGGYSVSRTIYNNAYGETTTYEEMTKKQESTSN